MTFFPHVLLADWHMQVVSGRKVAVDWAVPGKEFASSQPQKAVPGILVAVSDADACICRW